MEKIDLSIIILNYNTRNLLRDCLNSIYSSKNKLEYEIIVCDNGSIDGSCEMLKKNFKKVRIIENGANFGFAKGNNAARNDSVGKYILFLNTDTIMKDHTLDECFKYLEENKNTGAISCKVILKNGELDKDTRRSFITPFTGLIHLFLKLDRIFPKSEIFSKYWYGYKSEDEVHEVDAIQGAFFMTRKDILDDINWFDEDYFLDGEDIDLCWRIKKLNYKIIYYPKVKIIHLKGATKGKVESTTKKKISLKNRLKYRLSGVNSMEIFYRKRLWNNYPLIVNLIVLLGIQVLKFQRGLRTVVLG